MNTIDAVITRILDVRPYRHFWIVEVEVLVGPIQQYDHFPR